MPDRHALDVSYTPRTTTLSGYQQTVPLSKAFVDSVAKSNALGGRWDAGFGLILQQRRQLVKAQLDETKLQIRDIKSQDNYSDATLDALRFKRWKMVDELRALDALDVHYIDKEMREEDFKVFSSLKEDLQRAEVIPKTLFHDNDQTLQDDLQRVYALEESKAWENESTDGAPRSSMYTESQCSGDDEGNPIIELQRRRMAVRTAKEDRTGRVAAQAAAEWAAQVKQESSTDQAILDQYILIKRTEAIHAVEEAQKRYLRQRRRAKALGVKVPAPKSLSDDTGVSWDLKDAESGNVPSRSGQILGPEWEKRLVSSAVGPFDAPEYPASARDVCLSSPEIDDAISAKATDDVKHRSRSRTWLDIKRERDRDALQERARTPRTKTPARVMHCKLNDWIVQRPEHLEMGYRQNQPPEQYRGPQSLGRHETLSTDHGPLHVGKAGLLTKRSASPQSNGSPAKRGKT